MFVRTLLLALAATLVLTAGARADDKNKPPPNHKPPPAPPKETPEQKKAIEMAKEAERRRQHAIELAKEAQRRQQHAVDEMNAKLAEAIKQQNKQLQAALFEASLPDLNRKVRQFARDHQGKQVGNGECWTLAADALSAAGARRPGFKGIGVFDFGHKLGPGESPLPGDIIQLTHTKFEHKSTEHHGNKTVTKTHWVTVGNHHTAIVDKVDGKTITYLNQNHNGDKTVGATTINLDERKEGSVEFFRPVPPK
jgi:hypothetical protein